MERTDNIVDEHWKPNAHSLAMCKRPPIEAALHEPYDDSARGAIIAPDMDGVWPVVPLPFTGRTMVIWVRKDCSACHMNRPFFATLEQQADVMRVIRVEATPQNTARYPHVTVLPMYDIVTPRPSSRSAYGMNTHLVSIRNDERQHQLAAAGFRNVTVWQ